MMSRIDNPSRNEHYMANVIGTTARLLHDPEIQELGMDNTRVAAIAAWAEAENLKKPNYVTSRKHVGQLASQFIAGPEDE